MNEIAVRNNGQDLEKMAERFKLLIVNGKNLTAPEALALAQYSIATDLNPFANECYYLPGIGPGPGIAGWRKKADEQLEWEARKAAEPLARFWCDYLDASQAESGDLHPGDIAVKAVLHDTLSKTAWEKRRLGHFIELIKASVNSSEAWKLAEQLAGNEPTWSAIGIVRGGENFGSSEKMVRYERACKRAEKAAIRKRFPRVNLPEPMGFEDVIDTTMVEIKQPELKRPNEQILDELGYQQKPAPEPQPPADDQQDKPTDTVGIPAELAHLANICNDDGTPYPLIPTDKLSFMFNSLGKSLKDNGLSTEIKHEKTAKRDAAQFIITWRASHPAA